MFVLFGPLCLNPFIQRKRYFSVCDVELEGSLKPNRRSSEEMYTWTHRKR